MHNNIIRNISVLDTSFRTVLKVNLSTTTPISLLLSNISIRILLLLVFHAMLLVIGGVAGVNTRELVLGFRRYVVQSMFWQECH